MSRIDPLRLSRVLSSLARPKGERVSGHGAVTQGTAQKGELRNITQLRSSIGQRLRKIRDHDDFNSLAPVITVQEILCWEFGASVLEHTEFERVMQAVVSEMLSDEHTESIFRKIISNLCAEESG